MSNMEYLIILAIYSVSTTKRDNILPVRKIVLQRELAKRIYVKRPMFITKFDIVKNSAID